MWLEAQDAWASGDFSPEWREVRHQAAMRGIISPPEGTKWDSWEDEGPSQRAVVIRAIRDTPALLREAIGYSRSWFEVVGYVERHLNDQRADWRPEPDPDVPSNAEATVSLKRILDRIGAS